MNRNIFIASCLILLVSVQTAFAVNESAPTRKDGSNITYYLDRKNSQTLIVLMQGSDCNSVRNNKIINNAFSNLIQGADVLTIEKYGLTSSMSWNPSGDSIDCPEAYASYDSPDQRMYDYLQTIHSLDKKYHYEDIILLGGSEGALVAALVASHSQSISAVISINGGGRFFLGDVLYNMRHEIPAEAFLEAKAGFLDFNNTVIHSEDMDVLMSGHGFRWWKSMLTLDQTETLLQVSAPLLIIQSELDDSVSPVLAYKQAKLLKQRKSNVEFLSIEGVDHKFKDSLGKSYVGNVIYLIQEWMNKNRIASISR